MITPLVARPISEFPRATVFPVWGLQATAPHSLQGVDKPLRSLVGVGNPWHCNLWPGLATHIIAFFVQGPQPMVLNSFYGIDTLIRHELHDRSKIDLWEIKRALSGQLVAQFRKLEIAFYVELCCAVCFDLATFGPLAFPRTLVDISGLPGMRSTTVQKLNCGKLEEH